METPVQKKGWFTRNWKWFIPLVLLAIALFCACCVGAGLYGFVSLMKSTPAFTDGLALVQVDPRAQQLLGTPINAGLFVSGEISESGATGTAEISFPVSGPKGSGTVYVTAKKVEGDWIITRLVLVMDGTKEKVVIKGS
jgi:hypothetical protein